MKPVERKPGAGEHGPQMSQLGDIDSTDDSACGISRRDASTFATIRFRMPRHVLHLARDAATEADHRGCDGPGQAAGPTPSARSWSRPDDVGPRQAWAGSSRARTSMPPPAPVATAGYDAVAAWHSHGVSFPTGVVGTWPATPIGGRLRRRRTMGAAAEING